MALTFPMLVLLLVASTVDGVSPVTGNVAVGLYVRDTTVAVRQPSSVVVEVYNGSDKELIIRTPPVWYEKKRILPPGVASATTKNSAAAATWPAGDIQTGGTAPDFAYLVLRVWVLAETRLMGMGHSGAYDPEKVTIRPKTFHLFKVPLPDNTFLRRGEFHIEAGLRMPAGGLIWSHRVKVWAE